MERTVYTLSIHGRMKGAIGKNHDFFMTLIMDGIGHDEEAVKLEAYSGAENIHGFKILSAKPYSEIKLNKEQYEIMCHTVERAAGQRYCGSSSDMRDLVNRGLMKSLGKPSWCPDEYFTITDKGREAKAIHRSLQSMGHV